MRSFLFGIIISTVIFAGYMMYIGQLDLEFKFGYTTANAKIEAQMAEIDK
jgi:hypothetical protein